MLLWGQRWSLIEETEVSESYTFNLKSANSKRSD